MFKVPANTPIAIQPLDSEGRSLQLMRSWFTVRPGETLSCIGCHENENSTPITRRSVASQLTPTEITPFYGPERGFSFVREIQPILDQSCNHCHDGKPTAPSPLNLADRTLRPEPHSAGHFSVAYLNLNPFVRRPGPESDYHLLVAGEWCADTSPLVQMLKKGHHNVELSREAWDKLYAWIDLNAPFYGTYKETNQWNPASAAVAERRREMLKKYANVDVDFEAIPQMPQPPTHPIEPKPEAPVEPPAKLANWPLDPAKAKELQASAGAQIRKTIPIADGLALNLVLVPAGEFLMGDAGGYPDERPRGGVKIAKSFWMAETEISNRLFAQFDPSHDSRYQDMPGKDQQVRGYPANEPDQPVVRVSFQQAMAFCTWLSAKTGEKFTLPSEAQWEWACRGGQENAPAAELGKFKTPWGAAGKVDAAPANVWGLKAMYGNAWEWTLSSYRPYPYVENDGRNDPASGEDKVVRGGCWQDPLNRVRAGIRVAFPPYRALHHVGFRVILVPVESKG